MQIMFGVLTLALCLFVIGGSIGGWLVIIALAPDIRDKVKRCILLRRFDA